MNDSFLAVVFLFCRGKIPRLYRQSTQTLL